MREDEARNFKFNKSAMKTTLEAIKNPNTI